MTTANGSLSVAATSRIDVRVVETRADQKAFLRFERDLYADNKFWVPPLWHERKRLVGFKSHPFYEDAESTAFLAWRDGKVVGRIVAIVNHAHLRRYKDSVGFLGFFECVDDVDVAQELFNTAQTDLAAKGMTAARGPVHPSLNYECGSLVEGFDTSPTFLIPYNFQYYDRLWKACGYDKVQDLFSFEAEIELLSRLDPKMKFVVEESAKRFNCTTRPISRKNFHQDVRTFLHIYNESLQQTWGYVPMSESEVDDQAKALKWLLVPEMTSIAEIDGKAVGAGFGLLNYNVPIKKIGGKLLPFGWLTLLRSRRKINRLRLVSANVLPEYQRWGLGLVTLARVVPDAVARGVTEAEFSWVLESNNLSKNTILRGGATQSKLHRIYERSLTTGP